MADDKNTLHTAYGKADPEGLTPGGQGAGASRTDTGGLDADGNELGAVNPGTGQGREEGKRMDDADAAHAP